MSRKSASHGNRILSALSSGDMALLRPDLESRSLELRHSIEDANKPIKHVYFIESGFASVVSSVDGGRDAEIGIIGREGVTGSAVIMGNHQSPHNTYIQVEGTGQRVAATKLRRAMESSISLRAALLKSVQAFSIQTAHTAVANVKASTEQRLARWLLMAHDRLDGDHVPLTHEFLAIMLGIRRAGVTVALQELKRRKLIRTDRRKISIVSRAALEAIANRFYGIPESELRRLMRTRSPNRS